MSRRSLFSSAVVLAVGAALAAPTVLGPSAADLVRARPAPTEHLLDEDAEERNAEKRREWIERMHRAAPGVDWRAIERANGLERMERRRLLLSSRSAGPPAWAEIGSRNLAGRMHAVVVSADGDSLFAGSNAGGVWKADPNGQGWRPIADNLYGGAHGLAVCPGPPETITAITDGGLLHYTEDGGTTWLVPEGPLANINLCKRVIGDPTDPERVYVMVRKEAGWWRLYRSEDRGKSYVRIRNLSSSPGDFWLDWGNGGAIYCLEGATLLRSDDHGESWVTLGTIPGSPSNVILVGSDAGPTLYAAVNAGGWDLHRSTDAGQTWQLRSSGLTDFWQEMNVSQTDPDVFLYGGVEAHRSTDGGSTFSVVNGWAEYYGDPVNKLHADMMGIDVVYLGGQEVFFVNTDGGTYKSDDRVASVTNISLEYLGVSQYYSTLTSSLDPTRILAGSQDQGYQQSTGPAVGTWRDFDQVISGDYGHLTSSDGSHARVWSVYPGFVLVSKGEVGTPSLKQLDFPAGESYGVWMPMVVANPDDDREMYFCASHLHVYDNIAGDFYQVTQLPQDFTVAGGNFATALAISPVDTQRRVVVTDTGVLWYSTDAGTSWATSPDTGPSDHYLYGNALAFSNVDPDEAYVGGSGYSGPGVYRTTDGGVSWTPVSTGLPPTTVFDLAYEPGSSGVLYAATEAGPWRLDPGTDTWASIDGLGAPLTRFWSVEPVAAAGVMRFGTYGRGIWDFDYQAATSADEIGVQVAGGPPLVNFPNPFRAATTLRFSTPSAGPVRVRIYDVTGRLVRTLADGGTAAGEHRLEWDGRDRDGRQVAAGAYLARLEAGGEVAVRRMMLLR